MKKNGRVRLFIKPYCHWCREAMDWLDARGVEYETIDVVADERGYEEMVRLSGQSMAPVIEVHSKMLADFGARELARFWETLSA